MSLHSQVVHCKRDDYDVYIGRPSKWGNPFLIGKDGTRYEVMLKYLSWLRNQPELLDALPELKDKVLGCWCDPEPCHGDILACLANGDDDALRHLLSIIKTPIDS